MLTILGSFELIFSLACPSGEIFTVLAWELELDELALDLSGSHGMAHQPSFLLGPVMIVTNPSTTSSGG